MEPTAILNLIVWALRAGPAWSAAAQVWSESAASILIGSLWQGAIVACGLGLCMRLAPSIPARLRYGVWAAGFGALFCLPFLPALIERLTPIGFLAAPAHSLGLAAEFGVASESSSHALTQHTFIALDARWSLAIGALWLAASLLRATSLAAHAVRMRRLWNSASPMNAAHGGVLRQSVAARRAAPVEICVTSNLDRPCVIGFFRPRILIPAWLLSRLTPAELEQVVLHETEHLRRGDDWANLLQKLCLAAFPLNPALWWLERRLCAEREIACDDGVVRRTKAPRAYAACLAGLAERGFENREALRLREALSLGAWQRRSDLATRVHRLLRRPQVLSPVASWGAVAVVGCGLVAGTFALAHSPQLVAFVAPANPPADALVESANMLGAQQGQVDTGFARGPAAFAEHSVQSYRAVKTLAVLPAGRPISMLHTSNVTPRPSSPSPVNRAQQTGNSIGTSHSLASLVPEAVAARMRAGEISKSAAPQAIQTNAKLTASPDSAATQTSFLVLTTFEEVQTAGSSEDAQGDTVAREPSTQSSSRGATAFTSVRVTQLVLRFGPPASNDPSSTNSRPNSNTSPASNAQPNSNSSQPVAIAYRDWWFVTQL